MLTLYFNKSRSKNYQKAVKLAAEFDGYTCDEVNTVPISVKEIFEKWEFYNLLFWTIVDWKGTVLQWGSMKYHSHTDKTRIFYAMQQAHLDWIILCEGKIRQLYLVYNGQKTMEEIGVDGMDERDVDRFLDQFGYLVAHERYEKEYGHENFMNQKERALDRKVVRWFKKFGDQGEV